MIELMIFIHELFKGLFILPLGHIGKSNLKSSVKIDGYKLYYFTLQKFQRLSTGSRELCANLP